METNMRKVKLYSKNPQSKENMEETNKRKGENENKLAF